MHGAMTTWQYIRAGLAHYRRIHLAVAAGVAVATAVITGALLVGDSMRGSLRGLALQSLGRIDAVLLAEQPFREALIEDWLAAPSVKNRLSAATPLILTQGTASHRQGSGDVRRAARLQVIGAPPEFWSFAPTPSPAPVERGNRVALTASVAEELGVKVGDAVLLRLLLASSVPADSTLGKKDETSASRRFEVTAILSDNDESTLARFSIRPSQQAPRNVFVPLATLQDLLELDGKVNAAVMAGKSAEHEEVSDQAIRELAQALQPTLADLGLSVERITLGETPAGEPPPREYVRIAAERLVLPPHAVKTASDLYQDDGLQPVVTYLANRIEAGDRRIPYSTVAGVDSTKELGPTADEVGEPIKLTDDEIALNDWAARELGVKVGDSVTLTWYEPETTHGQLHEAAPLTLKVRTIVPLAGANGQPTSAADPNFAPELPGVTDQASIDDWDLPFELVEEIRDQDEAYWDEYRTTPKAFVSHALAARLWQTRWGTESVLRLPRTGRRAAVQVNDELRRFLNPAELGMSLVPVKRQALQAAAGTTPFDGLFLGFSFFLMASAVMLTALLFRLGVEHRASEAGLLSAVGIAPKRLRQLLIAEAGIVAAVGALVGAALGVGYARMMVYGLNTWWVDATAAPFLELHVTARSVLIGFAAGLLVALVTIWWSLRRFARLPARQLLAGDAQPPVKPGGVSYWSAVLLPATCIAAALAMGFAARRWEGETRALAFMGGGALVLAGVLLAVRGKLRETELRRPAWLSLGGLAARNARRNPSRTMLSLALAATASFLIVALSAFRLAPSDRGVGGFDLLASADLPVLYDLSSEEGRRELGFSDADNAKLAGAEIIGFRVREGEDASCLNLYKPTQPRVLGAPPSLAEASDFAWASHAELPPEAGQANPSPWNLLDSDLGVDNFQQPVVPMILDRNTALYSLKLIKVGDRLVMRDGRNQKLTLQVVAMLANSVLQGDVIISEAHFRRRFPEEAGERFFLVRGGAEAPTASELAALLETQLEDYGFDAIDARQRLGELLAVQNTYLSTFQSLGALGLLLGVVGLAVVQLRSVLERRGELALMQATGFRRRRLASMVLAENLVLLVGGLGIGCAAALVAVLPQAAVEEAGPPWATLAVLLGIVALAGAVAAWLASRAVLRAPLLAALRGD